MSASLPASLPASPQPSRPRGRSRRPALVLTAAVLALGPLALASPAAAAEVEPVTVPLDPSLLEVLLLPLENVGEFDPTSPTAAASAAAGLAAGSFGGSAGEDAPAWSGGALAAGETGTGTEAAEAFTSLAADSGVAAAAAPDGLTTVGVEYGGTVVLQLPAWVDTAGLAGALEMYPDFEAETPTRTYSTEAAPPDTLVVDDLGGGAVRVTLPADDTVSGPYALLVLDGLTTADDRVEIALPPAYVLEFTGTGTTEVDLQPGALLMGALDCEVPTVDTCPVAAVAPGTPLTLTVPETSPLRAFVPAGLTGAGLELVRVDGDAEPTEDDVVVPTEDPSAVSAAGPYEMTVALPADLRPGSYMSGVVTGDPADAVAVTFFDLDVVLPVNAGLRSDTGWVEPAADTTGSAGTAVALGGGLLALSATGVAVALRPRRRDAAGN